jgi:uncharacterized protein (TIGR03083 family)
MSDRTEYLAARLAQQCDESLALFRSLNPDQWKTVVYGDEGNWDVRTMLSHFVSSELSMQKLSQNIAEGGSGSPDDFDINRFNASRAAKMAEMPPDDLLRQFEEVRAGTIEYVRSLSDDVLDKQGRHATEGVPSIERIIKIIYKHNQVHEIDIRKALGLPQPERRSA